MLMREKIRAIIKEAAGAAGFNFNVSYPDPKFGDYATNAALVLAKQLKQKPQEVAKQFIEKMDKTMFESIEVAGAGFINFKLSLAELSKDQEREKSKSTEKILLEYFQPNIAKPLHVGHLRTAIIGDAIKRMLLYTGQNVESDTHMGDWGTQFGYLIMAYKKFVEVNEKLYAQLNAEAEQDPKIHEQAKEEFAKLEQGDAENRKIWQGIVDESVKEFLTINDLANILPFDHHWPESFYEDKMPEIIEMLKEKKLLVESQGAQIVNLEEYGLGIAIIIKSDKSTTYLLRDLAGFLFIKRQGFTKHLYVVDNRQSLHYRQLFKILELMGEFAPKEGQHIDYGFISFKGQVLSTRKGNMVFAKDVLSQAEEQVAKIIEEKNPDLKNKSAAVKAVSLGALKYYDLKHNRHSDIEFDWDQALDFDGDSGPYLQYAYARLSSILKKAMQESSDGLRTSGGKISSTERELMFKLSILPEIVEDALEDFLPNVLANYLYELATLINKFYHESPVTQEKDEEVKSFRLSLIRKAKEVLGQGLNLLGIQPLEEM